MCGRLPQAAAPTVDAATKYLIPRSIPTVSFRKPDQRTPLEPTFKAARAAEQTSAGVDNSFAMLSEAAATSLLFVGGSLLLTHLLRRKSGKQAIVGRADDVPHLRGPAPLTSINPSETVNLARLAVKRVLDQIVGAARDLNTAAAAMDSMRLAEGLRLPIRRSSGRLLRSRSDAIGPSATLIDVRVESVIRSTADITSRSLEV